MHHFKRCVSQFEILLFTVLFYNNSRVKAEKESPRCMKDLRIKITKIHTPNTRGPAVGKEISPGAEQRFFLGEYIHITRKYVINGTYLFRY